MTNNNQSSVDLLWNLIPKDTQNYIVKQFDGYNKAKAEFEKQIEDAYRIGKIESTMPNEINTTGKQYYIETFGTLAGETITSE
jgi:hypothetical protein